MVGVARERPGWDCFVNYRRATRVRNDLYERVLVDFSEAPDRVAFPVSRNR
ncbi:hypothetical protein ACFQFH_06675 [Halobaculum halobium]|uniref:Uncharacterized protein n=1 Tax=Halobaculum halobium TaxID=3032281 RepID=A0ABD5TEJ6_9EURY